MGYIDLMNLKSETEEPEVGFWIKTSQAGKGLATIATNAIVSYGFNNLGRRSSFDWSKSIIEYNHNGKSK